MPNKDITRLTPSAPTAGAALEASDGFHLPDNVFPASPSVALGADTAEIPPVTAVTLAPGLRNTTVPDIPGSAMSAGDPTSPRRRRRLWWLAGAAATLLLTGGIGATAYAQHYSSVALPGTSVSGTKVSGMSRQEIIDLVSERAEAVTVTLTGDVDGSATLAELGTTVDAEATADAVLARSSTVTNRFKALLTSTQVPVVVTSDDQAVRGYADSLVPTDSVLAKNAEVRLAEDGTSYVVVPGTSGKALDTTTLSEAAKQAATSLSTTEAAISFTDKDPEITDSDAQAAAAEANARISQEVSVSSADGQEVFTAGPATKASWVSIKTDESNTLHVQMDTASITSWVQERAAEVKIDPVTGKRNLSPSGQVLAVSVEAVDGSSVSNSEAIAKAIDEALSGNMPYKGSFEMAEDKATWEERTIAPGAENLAYQAAPGEKWVDINLSAKTLTAYEGATVVRGPEPMVDGQPETPTVTGVFHVYLKYETQTMRGQNADGTPYETENVPWVTYWHGSYALHGAPWRSTFGYSGSHGCVNLPVSTAQWYYNWTEMGTVVTSHW